MFSASNVFPISLVFVFGIIYEGKQCTVAVDVRMCLWCFECRFNRTLKRSPSKWHPINFSKWKSRVNWKEYSDKRRLIEWHRAHGGARNVPRLLFNSIRCLESSLANGLSSGREKISIWFSFRFSTSKLVLIRWWVSLPFASLYILRVNMNHSAVGINEVFRRMDE